MEKKWFESRTIWFNVFMGAAGVALGLKPELSKYVNETVFDAIWMIVNLFLRKDTMKAIV